MKILYCDIDSTINNHWKRIERWTNPFPGGKIDFRAFTRKEMLLDEPLENARYSLNKLSKHYSINFLSARSSMGYNSYRFIPEKLYNLPGGNYFFIMNVFSSKIFSNIFNQSHSRKTYAYKITEEWLKLNNFNYNSLTLVDRAEDKISFLKSKSCDLFIDDMSWGQNFGGSYMKLYDKEIKEIKKMDCSFELFNKKYNNWEHIVRKYLQA